MILMTEPQVWLNGRYIPYSAAAVPLGDSGFILGPTATEQLRTFGGRLFRLDEHLDRLDHSLDILGLRPEFTRQEWTVIASDLAAGNHALLDAADDLGLGIFVTPGPYATMGVGKSTGPTVGLYTYPLPFHLFAKTYDQGQALVTTDVEQVSPRSWPRELKCRSRVHYYLADRQAAQIEPGARAVLLDADGTVTETSTANIVAYRRDEGLVTPPRAKVLPGITLHAVAELAAKLSLPWREREMRPADLAGADELLITSTSSCMLPVVRFNGRPVGNGRPGEVFHQLLAAWNEWVGLDIMAQAKHSRSVEHQPLSLWERAG